MSELVPAALSGAWTSLFVQGFDDGLNFAFGQGRYTGKCANVQYDAGFQLGYTAGRTSRDIHECDMSFDMAYVAARNLAAADIRQWRRDIAARN